MPLTKSSIVRQKARLPTTLASLNSGHNFDLHACCTSVRTSCKPSLVLAKPLRPHSAALRSLFVANFNSTTSRHTPAIKAEPRTITSRCHVVAKTLACNLIWPCNSSVLKRCTNSFSVSLSLVSKLMRRRLSLHSSCLGTLLGSP